MNTNEIRCRDCGALIGDIRDGALVRPALATATHVPAGDLDELICGGWVMSPVVTGRVACRTCGLMHHVTRHGNELGEVTVTAEFREPFNVKRRGEIEASMTPHPGKNRGRR